MFSFNLPPRLVGFEGGHGLDNSFGLLAQKSVPIMGACCGYQRFTSRFGGGKGFLEILFPAVRRQHAAAKCGHGQSTPGQFPDQ